MPHFNDWLDAKNQFLIGRVGGHYALALACLLLPQVGEHRFALAAVIALIVAPTAYLLSRRYHSDGYSSVDHMIDIVCVVTLVHLTPQSWHTVLLIGVVLAQAPAISLQEKSSARYAVAYATLLAGMAFAGFIHQIEGWQLPIAVLSLLAPCVLFYHHQQMKVADELKRNATSNENLRLVAGSVAHDFNNILTSVIVNAELAEQSVKSGDKNTTERSVSRVIEGAHRASLLSRQLLSFSGRQVTEKSELDTSKELTSIVGLVKSIVPPGIQFELNIPDNLPALLADPAQIQQVFLNLLINAAEASDEDGLIRIDVKPVSPTLLEFSIRDEGCGIETEALSRIFEPFYTSKSSGHGLGLAAVEGIVRHHDGTITISSTKNEGTHVLLRLPAIPRHSARQLGREQERDVSSRRSILIADDEPAIRQLLVDRVSGMGFDVLSARDGAECIAQFQANAEDIRAVVLDLKMPHKNGWECLEFIHEREPALPVMLISGFNPQSDKIEQMNDSVRFLAKPFTTRDFDSTFSAVVEAPVQKKSAMM